MQIHSFRSSELLKRGFLVELDALNPEIEFVLH